ncbi:MAG TPA: hypothetical protein DDY98_00130 [Ruminococcaceae bacterium]|nr:hypothetical protein [Oscillospiraceae bacterium]
MIHYQMLSLGSVIVPAEILLEGTGAKEIEVPVRAVLVETDGKCILYDTGCGDGALNGSMPWICPESETLSAQLAKHNHHFDDITDVVLSHAHADHAGGAIYFPNADFWLTAEEWMGKQSLPGKAQHFLKIGEEPEIAPGVQLISLPGHTPNLLGLFLHENSRHILFPSDAAYSPFNIETPTHFPGACADKKAYESSASRIRSFVAQPNTEIHYFHWPFIRQ